MVVGTVVVFCALGITLRMCDSGIFICQL